MGRLPRYRVQQPFHCGVQWRHRRSAFRYGRYPRRGQVRERGRLRQGRRHSRRPRRVREYRRPRHPEVQSKREARDYGQGRVCRGRPGPGSIGYVSVGRNAALRPQRRRHRGGPGRAGQRALDLGTAAAGRRLDQRLPAAEAELREGHRPERHQQRRPVLRATREYS